MSVLYPLNIESTIPAFYKEQGQFKVAFNLNRATKKDQVQEIFASIKTIQSGSYITNDVKGTIDWDTMTVSFNLNHQIIIGYDNDQPILKSLSDQLIEGQFYKIQLYYKNTTELSSSYLSTVGIIKCTHKPELMIGSKNIDDASENNDLEIVGINKANLLMTEIVGTYKNQDITEKIYSYQFKLLDENKNIIESSNELLHNSAIDNSNNFSYDIYNFQTRLEINKKYYIEYSIKTINNLEISMQSDAVISGEIIPSDLYKCTLLATSNYDNGTVEIQVLPPTGLNGVGVEGKFILYRATADTNYSQWYPLYYFNTDENSRNYFPTNIILYTDYTVEHGKEYKYAIQQYDEKKYSSYLESNIIVPNFEDMYLYDGEKQLKIKFNPKVSSFKNTILEQKTDTIGNKYPFIFRNGNVNYKEFPISGLISYHTDDKSFFIDYNYNIYDLTGENISKEKEFKLEILNWLTNGEAKLFRSATEGNYLVRLLNISLNPNDTLGRMLHTFSSTAYEIAECNYNNYLKYNILKVNDINTAVQYTGELFSLINLRDISIIENNKGKKGTSLLKDKTIEEIFNIVIENAQPGTQFLIKIKIDEKNFEEKIITINSSGNYIISENSIADIYLLTSSQTGTITYNYLKEYEYNSQFANIEKGELNLITGENFISKTDWSWVGEEISKEQNFDNYFIQFNSAEIGIDDTINYQEGYRNSLGYFYTDKNLTNKISFEPEKDVLIKDLNSNLIYRHYKTTIESFDTVLMPHALTYTANNKNISIHKPDTNIIENNVNDIRLGYGLKIYNYNVSLVKIVYKER